MVATSVTNRPFAPSRHPRSSAHLDAHEILRGEVCPLKEASVIRCTIVANLVVELRQILKDCRGWRLLPRGVRLNVPKGEILFPDLMVVPPDGWPSPYEVRSPVLMADILPDEFGSPLNVARRDAAMSIPALQVYLAISENERLIDVHRRFSGSWTSLRIEGKGLIGLPTVGCALDLKTIYDGVWG